MNDEERRIITQYVERVAGAAQPAAPRRAPGAAAACPAAQARPSLPPVDREADALITDLFARYPEARYRITQTAFVQEAALVEAQNRIRQLEWEVENAQSRPRPQRPSRSAAGCSAACSAAARPGRTCRRCRRRRSRSIRRATTRACCSRQRGGSGFLGTALTTAAGVAGGMVLGNMLMGAFSGGGAAQAATAVAGRGRCGGRRRFGQEAVPTSSPWTDPGTAAADAGLGQRVARTRPFFFFFFFF